MHDPDRWLRLGVHWNTYVEIDDDDPLAAMSTRDDRLTTASTAVLMAPEEACACRRTCRPATG